MAGKKALFVGINKFANYSQFTLNGCVNDARDMAALYKDLLGFKATEMTVIANAQATKANIMSHLNAMVADAKAGNPQGVSAIVVRDPSDPSLFGPVGAHDDRAIVRQLLGEKLFGPSRKLEQ